MARLRRPENLGALFGTARSREAGRTCPTCGSSLRHRRVRPRKSHFVRPLLIAASAAAVAAGGVYEVGQLGDAQPAIASVHPYRWPHGVPRGVVLSGLQSYVMSPGLIHRMERQIYAISHYWYGNTVALQVLQDRLVGVNGNVFRTYYMRDVRELVQYALAQHLVVVISDQTELSTGYAQDEPLPTMATFAFWRHMMYYYGGKPRVIFDLFNEPRHCSWQQWYNDFQPLVNYIRRYGAYNQLWVEGIRWASTLEDMPLLKGSNIVYDFHHAGAPWGWDAPINPLTWDASFGYLAARGIPVIDGEFANYVGSYDWGGPRVDNQIARPLMVRYMQYLKRMGIGMLAWTLTPGSLNGSRHGFWSVSFEPQGDGYLVRHWFARLAGTPIPGPPYWVP